jgi:hypothetical protein
MKISKTFLVSNKVLFFICWSSISRRKNRIKKTHKCIEKGDKIGKATYFETLATHLKKKDKSAWQKLTPESHIITAK